MNILSIYDTCTHAVPMEQDAFLSRLDTTVRALMSRFQPHYVCRDRYVTPTSVRDEIPVYDAYMPAVVDNILYLTTGDTARKADYVEEARDAYKTVWSEKARGKKFVDGGWYDV